MCIIYIYIYIYIYICIYIYIYIYICIYIGTPCIEHRGRLLRRGSLVLLLLLPRGLLDGVEGNPYCVQPFSDFSEGILQPPRQQQKTNTSASAETKVNRSTSEERPGTSRLTFPRREHRILHGLWLGNLLLLLLHDHFLHSLAGLALLACRPESRTAGRPESRPGQLAGEPSRLARPGEVRPCQGSQGQTRPGQAGPGSQGG